MENETEMPTEPVQEDTSPDSAAGPDNSVIDRLQSEISSLQEAKAELESRIGDLARKSGEEKSSLESQYTQWADRTRAYYDEQLENARKTIAELEDQLIENLEDTGRKAVLDSKRRRDEEAEARTQAYRESVEKAQQALNQAKRDAAEAYEVEEAELTGTTPDEIWRQARRIDREKFTERIKSELQPAAPAPPAEEEPEPEEQTSKTPSSSTRGARREEPEHAELIQLREDLEAAKKARNPGLGFRIKAQIDAYERQHGLK